LLFDSTLGDWKTKPVSFQSKEGVSPYHGQAFPVPKVHKETIIKEVEKLCQLGVLERQPASEWALPSFIIPKKDKTVHFLSDFGEVNKRLVRKPFPISKISTVLQEIKGFSYATSLDLNMGYYTTPLDWIQMHQKSAPLYFLGASTPTRDYQWVLQVLQTFSKERCWS
jgi:hypothetical protein